MSAKRTQLGFTLLEILIALSIAAVGFGAVSRSLYQNIHVAERLSNKLVATWIASNTLAEMHIARQYQLSGGFNNDREMGGQRWRVESDYSTTGDTEVVRVDVNVYPENEPGQVAAHLFGYVAQPN